MPQINYTAMYNQSVVDFFKKQLIRLQTDKRANARTITDMAARQKQTKASIKNCNDAINLINKKNK